MTRMRWVGSGQMDLGLDSLMGMEIKQMVEREAGVVLSIKEIRTVPSSSSPFPRLNGI